MGVCEGQPTGWDAVGRDVVLVVLVLVSDISSL